MRGLSFEQSTELAYPLELLIHRVDEPVCARIDAARDLGVIGGRELGSQDFLLRLALRDQLLHFFPTAMIKSRYGMMSSRLMSVPWPGTIIVLASADFIVASNPSIMPLSEPPLLMSMKG